MQLIHCIITYAHNVIETERIFFWWKVYLEKTSVIARIWTHSTIGQDSLCLEHGKFLNVFTKLIRIKLNDIHVKYMRIMDHKIKVHLFCLNVCFLFYDCYTLSIGQILNPFWLWRCFVQLCVSEIKNPFLFAKQINSSKFVHIWFYEFNARGQFLKFNKFCWDETPEMLIFSSIEAVDEPTGQLKSNWTRGVFVTSVTLYKFNQKRVD